MLSVRENSERAFTLIELLIVLAVIGILATILLLVLNPVYTQNRAKDGVAITHIEKLAFTVETYQATEGSYPSTFTSGDNGGYIKNWPSHPTSGEAYTYAYNAGTPCIYAKMITDTNDYIKWMSLDGKIYKSCDDSSCAAATGCVEVK